MEEKTPQGKNKTTGTETEHHLNTERFKERHGATATQKEEEDLFSVMSQTTPCTECTVCLLHTLQSPRGSFTYFLIQNSHKDSPTLKPRVTDCVQALEPCCQTPQPTAGSLQINTAGKVQSLQYRAGDKVNGMNDWLFGKQMSLVSSFWRARLGEKSAAVISDKGKSPCCL